MGRRHVVNGGTDACMDGWMDAWMGWDGIGWDAMGWDDRMGWDLHQVTAAHLLVFNRFSKDGNTVSRFAQLRHSDLFF